MKPFGIASLLLSLFVTLPMWFFLMYSMLRLLPVDRLVWFIYWMYIPCSVVLSVIAKIAEGEEK